MIKIINTTSAKQTTDLGAFLAPFLLPKSVIALSGDLGAGKTTFTHGLAKGLGIHEHVISPTFNIMKIYHGRLSLYHIDAYRLVDGNAELGLEEFIDGDGVSVIEWPDIIKSMIPVGALHVVFKNTGGNNRNIRFETDNPAFFSYLEGINKK
jgi:tRNA threonylcarbamoyladenosine biosynthesis protein TsaE